MKKHSVAAKASIWATLFLCMAMAWSCWAAESTGDNPVKSDTKEKYRQEIMGGKGAVKVDNEYVIGYRDILYVEVYGEGSMTVGPGSPAGPGSSAATAATPGADAQGAVRGRGAGAEVGIDGRVSLRNIGDVYVVGMTMTQLADYLKKLYSTVFDKPTVITSLVQSNSRQYTMMGQVKAPGLFHLDFPTTVVKAIAKAGGMTEWASSKITIIRQSNELVAEGGAQKEPSKGQRFNFDYDDYLKGKDAEKNILIEPGDVVVVH
jgi:polysaccharide export outer membrane protein